jgi:hypothetical protein
MPRWSSNSNSDISKAGRVVDCVRKSHIRVPVSQPLYAETETETSKRKKEREKARSLVVCYHSAPLCLFVKRVRLLWRLVFDRQGQVQI